MATAASRRRCGLLVDLVSTANIIRTGVPHLVGEFIYEYLAAQHNDKLSLKFVFVGITDNANCCAARDVICRDDWLDGQYVGDMKRRDFDALDNVHVFAVFPSAQTRTAGFATLGGGGGSAPTRAASAGAGNNSSNATGGAGPRPGTAAFRLLAEANKKAVTVKREAPSNAVLQSYFDDDDVTFEGDGRDQAKVEVRERTSRVPDDIIKSVFDRRDWCVFARATPTTGMDRSAAAASG